MSRMTALKRAFQGPACLASKDATHASTQNLMIYSAKRHEKRKVRHETTIEDDLVKPRKPVSKKPDDIDKRKNAASRVSAKKSNSLRKKSSNQEKTSHVRDSRQRNDESPLQEDMSPPTFVDSQNISIDDLSKNSSLGILSEPENTENVHVIDNQLFSTDAEVISRYEFSADRLIDFTSHSDNLSPVNSSRHESPHQNLSYQSRDESCSPLKTTLSQKRLLSRSGFSHANFCNDNSETTSYISMQRDKLDSNQDTWNDMSLIHEKHRDFSLDAYGMLKDFRYRTASFTSTIPNDDDYETYPYLTNFPQSQIGPGSSSFWTGGILVTDDPLDFSIQDTDSDFS